MYQLDEEQKCSEQYKEHLMKPNNHFKQLEKQLDKTEEECSRIKTARRKIK